jgi:apolipoprotein N-acyltransferase
MQSVLEREARLLLLRFRDWGRERDRAVLFGTLLCCVPFLPVTFVGLAITLLNLLLVRLGKLPRAELPALIFALGMTAFYILLWWMLFALIASSTIWLTLMRFWSGLVDMLWWFRVRGSGFNV